MVVESPSWIELKNCNDTHAFEEELFDYIKHNGEPSIIVIMVAHEKYYRRFKNVCYA